jgi:hypothetical protein
VNDVVAAKFYYPSTVTGANETNLQLFYFTAAAIWAPVLSSGGNAPAKDTTDNLDGTVSGGRFSVTFDGTSTPKVTDLIGTVFTGAGSVNQPPIAACHDVTVAAGAGVCSASASIDNGSSDPDGDPITLAQSPAGPYALGSTVVTLTVTDGQGASDSCQATITVVDQQPPAVQCVPGTNPVGKTPAGPAGFYRVSAQDACSATTLRIGSFTLADGETIKITQAPGVSGVTLVNAMGPGGIRHFHVGSGLAAITATDAAGNLGSAVCPVPPK